MGLDDQVNQAIKWSEKIDFNSTAQDTIRWVIRRSHCNEEEGGEANGIVAEVLFVGLRWDSIGKGSLCCSSISVGCILDLMYFWTEFFLEKGNVWIIGERMCASRFKLWPSKLTPSHQPLLTPFFPFSACSRPTSDTLQVFSPPTNLLERNIRS